MQLGLLLAQFMTIISYVRFVHRARLERAAVKRANGGKFPDLLTVDDAPQDAPVATVVHEESEQEAPAEMFPPEATLPAPETDTGPSCGHMWPPSPLYTQSDQEPIVVDSNVHAPKGGSFLQAGRESAVGPIAEAFVPTKSVDVDSLRKSDSLAAAVEADAAAAAEAANKGSGGFIGYFKKLWDSVKEDPRIGFRCTTPSH